VSPSYTFKVVKRGRKQRVVRVTSTKTGESRDRVEKRCSCGMWINQSSSNHSPGNLALCSDNPWR
jgi:hypothetical protein